MTAKYTAEQIEGMDFWSLKELAVDLGIKSVRKKGELRQALIDHFAAIASSDEAESAVEESGIEVVETEAALEAEASGAIDCPVIQEVVEVVPVKLPALPPGEQKPEDKPKTCNSSYVEDLVIFLTNGATAKEVCERFGWKTWNPNRSAVLSFGALEKREDGKFYLVSNS